MAQLSVAAELEQLGPQRPAARAATPAEAAQYCRRLAQQHYENFTVASLLLPRELRPHFHAIYAYCRWADDLADETGGGAESLRLLDWWQEQLECCYDGQAEHPVFVALGETIRQFEIPREPFVRLLEAFRQDQRRHALPDPRRRARLLPELGQPRGAVGALPGRATTTTRGAAGRFDLDGPATGELLPGRGPRLGQGAGVFAARDPQPRRLSRGDVRRGDLQRCISRRARRGSRAGREVLAGRRAAGGTVAGERCGSTWRCSSRAAWPWPGRSAPSDSTCGASDRRFRRPRNCD